MRVIGLMLLVLTLAGCTGDRTKQSMNRIDVPPTDVAS
jgi:hypothetical protein